MGSIYLSEYFSSYEGQKEFEYQYNYKTLAHGYGQCIWLTNNNKKATLSGNFIYGVPSFGVLEYHNGCVYRGEFENGKCNITWNDGKIDPISNGHGHILLSNFPLNVPREIYNIISSYTPVTIKFKFSNERNLGLSPIIISLIFE